MLIGNFKVMEQIEIKHSIEPVNYLDALDFMETRVNQIIAGNNKQLIWFLEHPPIYTAGTGADMKDLLTDKLELYKSGRGGKITYHGPGQRIIYLMLDIVKLHAPNKPDLKKFIRDLESWIISSLEEIGVKAFTKEGLIGIWTSAGGNDEKIAALGIRVRKWVSYHGVSINICPDMDNYKGIIPCGISEFGVTSLKKIGVDIQMSEFDKILEKKFVEFFL